jgi:hypothetical protein
MVERFYCGEAPRQVTFRESAERQPLEPRFDLREHSSIASAGAKMTPDLLSSLPLLCLPILTGTTRER